MDTSFLRHVYGLVGVKCTATHYKTNKIVLDIEYSKTKKRCPCCGEYTLVKNGYRYRNIHALPIGSTKTILHMKVQRYKCKECGNDDYERVSFVKGNRSYSNRFAKYVVDLLRAMTIQEVSKRLGVSWDVVKDIHTTYLKSHYSKPSLQGVQCIGIDEFAVRKGHVYKTIVVDLISGRILHVGDGKGADALTTFWKRVRKRKVQIKYVATDMSSAFSKSVRENTPDAIHVFDHFHVIKLMNDTLDKVRRELVAKEEDEGKKKLIKGTRYLLLANGEKMTDEKGRTKLQKALAMNEPLSQAYYLKEDLREIYNQRTINEAEERLNSWVSMALDTDSKPLMSLANTINAAKKEILAWYYGRLSTAKVEGINNKIKVMKRNAYGYRDDDYFKLRLFALHDCLITRNVG